MDLTCGGSGVELTRDGSTAADLLAGAFHSPPMLADLSWRMPAPTDLGNLRGVLTASGRMDPVDVGVSGHDPSLACGGDVLLLFQAPHRAPQAAHGVGLDAHVLGNRGHRRERDAILVVGIGQERRVSR